MTISKANVRRFAQGTAEHVVMHALWSVSRGRNPSANFSWLKNPSKALSWAKHHAYFPESGSYLESSIPEGYVCGECGVSGVKLWREYNTFLDHQSLRCLSCACKEQKKVRTPTEDGKSLYTDEIHHMYRTADMEDGWWKGYDPKKGPPPNTVETKVSRDKTDQIGWRIPAVPTEDGTYWGYTSVPSPGVQWWTELPYAQEA